MAELYVLGPDDPAPGSAGSEKKKKSLTIVEAVQAGDRLAELQAMHLRLARAVQADTTPARDLAALSRRQMEISREVEALLRQQKEESQDGGGPSEDEAWDEEAI